MASRTSDKAQRMAARATSTFQPRCLAAAVAALVSSGAWAQQAAPEPAVPLAQTESTMPQVTVQAKAEKAPGTITVISGEELEKANSMADISRYQPLVSAPGTASGTSRNRSSFDRSGTTGYNIRGIEGNRIGMDVDGIEMPDASTRPYVSRAGNNTFGIGRDFIDPEMFSSVGIQSGTTTARRAAGGIGGAVSFKTKSASDFLRNGNTSYFGGKLGFDSADHSWNESITAAGKSGSLDGLIAFSRRDGKETQNNSALGIKASPEDWHSNALLMKGGLQIDAENRLELSADLYRRSNKNQFYGWSSDNSTITQNNRQDSDTSRNTLQLSHLWTPTNAVVDQLDTRLFFQNTDTEDVTDTTTLAGGATTRNLSQNKTKAWGLSTTGDKHIGRHRISFGFNAQAQSQERPWNVPGYMKPQPDTDTTRLGAFIQDDIGFDVGGKRLGVIPALRVDRVQVEPKHLGDFAEGALTEEAASKLYSNLSSTIWSPSLGLTYALTPQFIAYGQYKRSGRAPTAGEVFGSWNMDQNYAGSAQYALIGNSNLKQETSNAFEIGVKGSPADGVLFNASTFYTRYKDFIGYTRYTRASAPDKFSSVPAHIGTIYQAENRDEATIYGLEMSARLDHGQWAPAVKGLYSTWALGLAHGTSKSYYAGDKDVPLDTIQPRKAVIGVGYDAPMRAWGVNMTGTFVAGKQAQATNRDSYTNAGSNLADSSIEQFRVPGYALFDLSGYWQINKNARLNVGIYNLADKRYWDYASSRSLQPSVAKDQRDIQLLTNPGRTYAVSLNVNF
ncbi:TonB-dependent hemoglobin/transferrin/lactoferrin family receptor [Comamonas sediminis]|uniref:TonB-dependent hemoglobin/transferrin/lactoferrin family receptor n=1 Tax=Comamonas sediminis TaxID=1783360 RepID=UPI003D2BA6A0